MIRQLTQADDPAVQQLIRQKPAENLFIIGDVEAFGYEEDFQTLWGEFDDDGKLQAVLLKYEENFIPFSLGAFDAKGFATIMNSSESFTFLSGLKEIVSQIEPYLTVQPTSKREFYYAKCTHSELLVKRVDDEVKKVTLEEIPQLVDLLTSIPEFHNSQTTIENKKRNMEKGVSRSYYFEEDGKMVSTASTTAENSLSAMIVGVATDAHYKRKGYATRCLNQLCLDILAEGKELCLFYDNPEAGKIYKRLGFEDIGFWSMNTFK